jgi:thiamine pyrophosphate-dependent acetolactate synthase large subunit-like protein
MGAFATEQGRALFGQADLLVAIGTSLNPYIQDTAYGPHGHLAPAANIIQIDQDPAHIGDYQPVALGITADATAAVEAISAALGPATKPAWAPGAAPAAPAPEDGKLSTAAFLTALDPMLPADRTVVVDCGLFVFPLIDAIRCEPEHFIWTMNFGAVGMALAIGIGAAVGAPQRPCFVFAGDGGFTMAPQEIMTAAANAIPITVVILDDGAYGAEAHLLKKRGKPLDLALLPNPDLAAMARSMGADAVTVRSLADLAGISARLVQPRERPLIIHAIVERPSGHRAIP